MVGLIGGRRVYLVVLFGLLCVYVCDLLVGLVLVGLYVGLLCDSCGFCVC